MGFMKLFINVDVLVLDLVILMNKCGHHEWTLGRKFKCDLSNFVNNIRKNHIF